MLADVLEALIGAVALDDDGVASGDRSGAPPLRERGRRATSVSHSQLR